MPANIAVIDGKAAVVLAREPAWHGLGTVVDWSSTPGTIGCSWQKVI